MSPRGIEGCVLAPGLPVDHLSILFEPGMGFEASTCSSDSDPKRRGNPSSAEEPGKDQGLLQAGGFDGRVSARHLHEPYQVGDPSRTRGTGFLAGLQRQLLTNIEEPVQRQQAQREVSDDEKPPGLTEDQTITEGDLKKLM